MKILNVQYDYENPETGFVDMLLKGHYPNNSLFDRTILTIVTSKLSSYQLIKRRFWEQAVLKRQSLSTISPMPGKYPYDDIDSTFVYMSLSEALLYIDMVTPPIMKKRVNNSLDSVETIRSMLEMYLTEEDSPQYEYNMSIFTSLMSFNENTTGWDYDNKRLETMHMIHPNKNIVGVIDAIDGDIKEAMHGRIDAQVQCTIEARGHKATDLLSSMIGDRYAHIVNMNIEGDIIRVTVYLSNIRPFLKLRKFLMIMHKIQ